MHEIVFREYDIRGIVGVELFIETTYDLACAIAVYIKQHNPHHNTIIVGMDVRTHAPALHAELIRGLRASGYTIIDLGVCTSPMLYFATHTLPCAGGVMVTASHNPQEYNGFKIVVGTEIMWGDAIREIKQLYKSRAAMQNTHEGRYIYHAIAPAYIAWLLEQFPVLKKMQLPVAFDCANGATSVILPAVIRAFDWPHATVLYAEPDGTFPHHEADPIHLHHMQDLWQTMQHKQITIGIGFDGDGDRMDALDETGYLIPGDHLVGIFAHAVLQKYPERGVVCDITVSSAVVSAIHHAKGNAFIVPCGVGNIKKAMREQNAIVGGELSCHFFFNDRSFGFDDGIYAALRLLEIMVTTGCSLEQLRMQLPQTISSPQYRVACREETKKELVSLITEIFCKREDARVVTVDGARVELPHSWGLVRASNTQPALVFRFESQDAAALRAIKKQFADMLSVPMGTNLHELFGV